MLYRAQKANDYTVLKVIGGMYGTEIFIVSRTRRNFSSKPLSRRVEVLVACSIFSRRVTRGRAAVSWVCG